MIGSLPEAGRRRRGVLGRPRAQDRPRFLWLVAGFVAVFLTAPIAVVVVFSFNSAKSINTFASPSLRWYSTLAHDSTILASIKVSLEIAIVTTLVATLIGSLLAIGLSRGRSRLSGMVQGILLLTLITPEVATGMALFLLFYSAHVTLSTFTVILGHVSFSIVFVVVIVRARLSAIPRDTEEAALDLGATQWNALRLVTLPQLWPAVIGAALLTFVFSFDDFVTSFFTTGVGANPLPVYIYSLLKFGISPEINAVGTLMIVASVLIGILAIVLLRLRQQTANARLLGVGE
jgi:spermidine/putrescine transport system permease protein